ncbi:hypothetical protein [Kutzneria kofuensis]|uniref:Uncharacterized protein n=1 Tax=Kutzneria kofuensis TaxID=103725 RepID=A0A7W9KCP8_9PSEU|nr:hypothetical protein [Kutzneria kofuensis]MBB5890111.1 hypothetical protein [Kutzneria kofuensis]
MTDLLNSVIEAHGGLDAWSSVDGLTVAMTAGDHRHPRRCRPSPADPSTARFTH